MPILTRSFLIVAFYSAVIHTSHDTKQDEATRAQNQIGTVGMRPQQSPVTAELSLLIILVLKYQ